MFCLTKVDVAPKKQTKLVLLLSSFIWLDAKMCKSETKVRFLSIIMQLLCGVTSVAKNIWTLSYIKIQKCMSKDYASILILFLKKNSPLRPSSQLSVNLRMPFWMKKSADLTVRLHASCKRDLQEINKLSTKRLRIMKQGQFKH